MGRRRLWFLSLEARTQPQSERAVPACVVAVHTSAVKCPQPGWFPGLLKLPSGEASQGDL